MGEMDQQIWSLFWAVPLLFFPLGIFILWKKCSKISVHYSSRSESWAEQQPLPATSLSDSVLPSEYEVFLSFRGPDVRTTFADFLYSVLDRSKIRTFFDNEEIRKGEKVSTSILKAIGESKVYIPIFSLNYASSKWCLQELAEMVKCYKQGEGHLILPIFYLVDPEAVRRQQGTYEKAFEQHSKKYDTETINGWKEALQEAGQIKGWHVTESDGQGAVVNKVFSEVWSHLIGHYVLMTDELIGIDVHVERMTELLELDCGDVQVIGIHGMGGIGKTTIAKAVYNKICAQFDHCCFLEDVRDTMSRMDGIVTLQSKIISSILRQDHKVQDANEGIHIINQRICKCKVLIILDGVDHKFKFDKVFGKQNIFFAKSRFIVTTRDERVMEFFPPYKLYKPEEMGKDHSLQLFSRHAFGMDYPPKDYIALSKEFVEVASGLPLALKVIGSLLFRRNDKSFWKAKRKQFKDILPSEVQETLKISYLELTYEEKQIFLDIACFFIGEEKEQPSYMWSDCGFHPEVTINTLVLRSLIKVHAENKFWMHDYIRDLGRAIVREEDFQYPWKRSRIWSKEDALDMLTDEKGTDRLEVLTVDMDGENFELTKKAFQKLSGLRYLQVCSGRLSGDFEKILPNLRWLRLHECSSIPIDFNVKKLVILDLMSCPVRDDWRSWNSIKEAHRLRAVDLSFCDEVRKVPDLSHCRSLERINFECCSEMGGELHFGNFENLTVLNLSETKITKLLGDIGRLQNLQTITVDNSRLRELSASIGELSSLKILHLTGLEIEVPELPTSLKWLSLSSPRVPNLLELKDLEKLWLSCDTLEIPWDLFKLSNLKDLSLMQVGNEMDALVLHHESIEPNSQSHYSREPGMRTIISSSPTLPASLNTLSICGCQPLERLPNLANLSNLMTLYLSHIGVCEIPDLVELRMLEKFHLWDASNLINLDGLAHLELLEELSVNGCDVLRKLPNLSNLTKLRELKIIDCPLLSEIQGLGEMEDLSFLLIKGCHQLAGVMGLDKLESLQQLVITDCTSIKELPDLSALKYLWKLRITGCNELTEVTGTVVGKFGTKERDACGRDLTINSILYNFHTNSVEDLTGRGTMYDFSPDGSRSQRSSQMEKKLEVPRLLRLHVLLDASNPINLDGIEHLELLEELIVRGCGVLKKLLSLSNSTELMKLKIIDCPLSEIQGLDKLESLLALLIIDCKT